MILKVSQVFKSYQSESGQSLPVLKGVDLSINDQQSVSLVGQSGSGKSTLLNLISGLDTPDLGEIALNGKPLHLLSEPDRTKVRAEDLGIIFQNFYLVPHLNALENVLLPFLINGRNVEMERAKQLLSAVGLDHRETHLPSQLSGGEKQRVCIARALVLNPKLVIADEPTGNLDEATTNSIIDLIFATVAVSKASLLLVTHDIELASRCDQKLRLKDGIIHV